MTSVELFTTIFDEEEKELLLRRTIYHEENPYELEMNDGKLVLKTEEDVCNTTQTFHYTIEVKIKTFKRMFRRSKVEYRRVFIVNDYEQDTVERIKGLAIEDFKSGGRI